MSKQTKPEIRQIMYMHLNGGNKFSELHYYIKVDGKETDIMRHKRTNGSPKYLITEDVLVCGDERFDIKATQGVGIIEWILAHVEKASNESV